MKVVLIGANGQLGTAIRRATQMPPFDWVIDLVPLTRAEVDITSPDLAAKLDGVDFDVLINTAAFHQVDACEQDQAKAGLVNTKAVQELAAICSRRRAQFVHVSTDFVFGGDVAWSEDGRHRLPFEESDDPSPLNAYGASKAAGEEAACRMNEDGTTIVRVASLFGHAGSSGKGGNFIETMLRKAAAGDPIEVVDDVFMSPTSAMDAAGAILHLVKHRLTGTFHAVNSGYTSWFGLAAHALFEREANLRPCAMVQKAGAARRPMWSVLAHDRLARYGYVMPHWCEAVNCYLAMRD